MVVKYCSKDISGRKLIETFFNKDNDIQLVIIHNAGHNSKKYYVNGELKRIKIIYDVDGFIHNTYYYHNEMFGIKYCVNFNNSYTLKMYIFNREVVSSIDYFLALAKFNNKDS